MRNLSDILKAWILLTLSSSSWPLIPHPVTLSQMTWQTCPIYLELGGHGAFIFPPRETIKGSPDSILIRIKAELRAERRSVEACVMQVAMSFYPEQPEPRPYLRPITPSLMQSGTRAPPRLGWWARRKKGGKNGSFFSVLSLVPRCTVVAVILSKHTCGNKHSVCTARSLQRGEPSLLSAPLWGAYF